MKLFQGKKEWGSRSAARRRVVRGREKFSGSEVCRPGGPARDRVLQTGAAGSESPCSAGRARPRLTPGLASLLAGAAPGRAEGLTYLGAEVAALGQAEGGERGAEREQGQQEAAGAARHGPRRRGAGAARAAPSGARALGFALLPSGAFVSGRH